MCVFALLFTGALVQPSCDMLVFVSSSSGSSSSRRRRRSGLSGSVDHDGIPFHGNSLCKASNSFGQLSQRLWQSYSLRLSTKMEVCRTVVVPTLCVVQLRPGSSTGHGSYYWNFFTNTAGTAAFASNGKTTCQTKKSRETACPAQTILLHVQLHRLCWPRRQDGKHTHALSSLLQPAPKRKEWWCCSPRALQRPDQETACTSENQLSIVAAGLRLGQPALINERERPVVSSRQNGTKPQKRMRQKEPAASQSLSANLHLSKVQWGLHSNNPTDSHQRAWRS